MRIEPIEYHKFEFNSDVIYLTDVFGRVFQKNPEVLDKIILAPKVEKFQIDDYDVYYTRVEVDSVPKKSIDVYVKEVPFIGGNPVGRDQAFGNKSPEREFFNYLRLRGLKRHFNNQQRSKLSFAYPLFCLHGYDSQKSYLVTEALNNAIELDKILKLDRVPLETKIKAIETVEEGMKILHSKGVLYRDTNPENFLLSRTNISKCTFIDPEYTLFQGDDVLMELIRSSGKSFPERAKEELLRFYKQTKYDSLKIQRLIQHSTFK